MSALGWVVAVLGVVLVAVVGVRVLAGGRAARERRAAIAGGDAGRTGGAYRSEPAAPTLLPRPLRIDPVAAWRAWLGGVGARALAAALGVVVLAWVGRFALAAHALHSVWRDGAEVTSLHVEVHERHHGLLLRVSEFTADYTAPDGSRQIEGYTRWSMFGGVDRARPMVVRVDPADPRRFALSWVIEGFAGEVVVCVVVVALGLVLALGLMVGQWSADDYRGRVCAVLHAGAEEVVLAVISVEDGQLVDDYAWTTYVLRAPEGERTISVWAPGTRPMFLDLEETQVLGLRRVDAPAQIVVLRDDLWPLLVDEEASERVRRQFRERRGA